MKPKDDKKASHDVWDPKIGVKRETRLHSPGFEDYKPPEVDIKEIIDAAVDLAQPTPFNPTSPRLMAVFELLTNKSFPRKKGKGKSTKIVMLDAIIVAAIDKKLILQEEKDVRKRQISMG